MQKLKDPTEREFYIHQTVIHGWSRAVLVHQIESGLHRRQGQALNNFDRVLPAPQSDLARETLKDPYIFDFLSLGDDVSGARALAGPDRAGPIGVASYRTMPAHLRGTLPSPREIEAGLVGVDAVN